MSNETEKKIRLIPLSEQEISRRKVSLGDLWMLKDESDHIYGPYSTQQLIDYAVTHSELLQNSFAYNLATEDWDKFFQIPHFQRRINSNELSLSDMPIAGEFYLMQNGQRLGPYTTEQLRILLDQKKLLFTDLISTDEGKTWIKLYDHHLFDRREKDEDAELPYRPNEEIFAKVQELIPSILKQQKDGKQNAEALLGVIYKASEKKTNKAQDKQRLKQKRKRKLKRAFRTPSFSLSNIGAFLGRYKTQLGILLLLVIVPTLFNTMQGQFHDNSSEQFEFKRAPVQQDAPENKTKPEKTKQVVTPTPKATQRSVKVTKKRRPTSAALKSANRNNEKTAPQARNNRNSRRSRPVVEEINLDDEEIREELDRSVAADEEENNDFREPRDGDIYGEHEDINDDYPHEDDMRQEEERILDQEDSKYENDPYADDQQNPYPEEELPEDY